MQVKLVRVVRNEVGRPFDRGRIHRVELAVYTVEQMVETLCGLEMWAARASEWDRDNLDDCTICKRVVNNERLARRARKQ